MEIDVDVEVDEVGIAAVGVVPDGAVVTIGLSEPTGAAPPPSVGPPPSVVPPLAVSSLAMASGSGS